MSSTADLTVKVRAVLEDSARAGRTITFAEIEKQVEERISAWNKLLDPIYEDCITKGHPDVTVIVIYKDRLSALFQRGRGSKVEAMQSKQVEVGGTLAEGSCPRVFMQRKPNHNSSAVKNRI
jgi:hypothetical protein